MVSCQVFSSEELAVLEKPPGVGVIEALEVTAKQQLRLPAQGAVFELDFDPVLATHRGLLGMVIGGLVDDCLPVSLGALRDTSLPHRLSLSP